MARLFKNTGNYYEAHGTFKGFYEQWDTLPPLEEGKLYIQKDSLGRAATCKITIVCQETKTAIAVVVKDSLDDGSKYPERNHPVSTVGRLLHVHSEGIRSGWVVDDERPQYRLLQIGSQT